MTHNIHVLLVWIRVCVCIAAVSTTAVPTIYAFSPWWKRRLGQIFMLKATSFALTLDLTVLFIFWHPKNILIYFWTEAIAFTMISISTSLQAFMIWQLRRKNRKDRKSKVTLSNKFYDVLKFVAQVLLPAAGTLYVTLAALWDFPSPEAVVGTIVAVDTFLGVLLHISTSAYNTSDSKFAGTLTVHDTEDGSELHLNSVDPNKVLNEGEAVFKVNKGEPPVLP
jgi:hypothetical protein